MDEILPTPDEYYATLQNLTLRAVLIDRLITECNRTVKISSEINVNININSVLEQEEENGQYSTLIEYEVKAISLESDEWFFSLCVRYRVIFDKTCELPNNFFKVFSDMNLRLTTFPYLRELVSSSSLEMGVPLITLPFLLPGLKEAVGIDEEPIQS